MIGKIRIAFFRSLQKNPYFIGNILSLVFAVLFIVLGLCLGDRIIDFLSTILTSAKEAIAETISENQEISTAVLVAMIPIMSTIFLKFYEMKNSKRSALIIKKEAIYIEMLSKISVFNKLSPREKNQIRLDFKAFILEKNAEFSLYASKKVIRRFTYYMYAIKSCDFEVGEVNHKYLKDLLFDLVIAMRKDINTKLRKPYLYINYKSHIIDSLDYIE